MANRVVIDVEARFVDNVTNEAKSAAKSFDNLEKSAEAVQKDLSGLGKTKAKPKVDLDSNSAAKKLNDMDKKLNRFRKTKAEAKLSVLDRATAIIDKVTSKAKAFASKVYSGIVKVRDSNVLSFLNKASSGLKSLTSKAWSVAVKIKDTFTAPLTKLKNMLFSVKTLIAGIVAGWAATKLIGAPISLADQYSSAKIGFSTLLGDAGGQKMMNDLDAFAKKTPFNTSGVIANAQKMMAMGWDVNTILQDLEVIGNAAAATGKLDQGLESIVRAMSQIKTKGKLSTEELNQLAEAGIAAKAMLAENLGYGTGDEGIAAMTADLEKGAIASNVAIQALLQGMQKYDGMMDSMANETVEGLWSQLKDTFEINIVRKWGQGLQDGAKRGFGTFQNLLDKSEDALSSLGDTLHELGKAASNWVADKLDNLVQKVKAITQSAEFAGADLKGKLSMLWRGIVSDPLSEWWESTGKAKMAKTAKKIGETIGKMLTAGLLALFGATEALDKIGEDSGNSIAGSFVSGFLANFDGQAITDAFANAIGNVWNALPGWAKLLIGGYGAGMLAKGISSLAGGITTLLGTSATMGAANVMTGGSGLLGLIGTAGVAGVGASGLLGFLSKTGYRLMGGTSALSIGGGAAALAGGGALAGGATIIKGGVDLYKAYTTDDQVESGALKRSGYTALGGVGTGAAIGSIFGPAGTLIGAGIGGLVGWIGGNHWADNYREKNATTSSAEQSAKQAEEKRLSEMEAIIEREKAIQQGLADHFGDISMTMDEISTEITEMFGKDLIDSANATKDAFSQMAASLETFENANSSLKKVLWMSTLRKEAKLSSDKINELKTAVTNLTDAAKTYVQDAQYASSEAIAAIMGDSAEARKVLDKSTAYYSERSGRLESLTYELSKKMNAALADNVISIDEEASIQNIRNQIANITAQIDKDQFEASMNTIKAKYNSSDMTYETFGNMIDAAGQTSSEMVDSIWEQFGQASIGLTEGSNAWNALLKETLKKIKEPVMSAANFGLDKLQTKYSDDLGILGSNWSEIISNNTVTEIGNAARELASNEKLRGEIGKVLELMKPTTDQVQDLADAYTEAGMEIPNALMDYLNTTAFYEAIAAGPQALKDFWKTSGSLETNEIIVPAKIIYDVIEEPEFQNAEGKWTSGDDLEFQLEGHADVEWTYDPFNAAWIEPDGVYGFTTNALVNAGWTYDEFDKKWISPDETYSFSTSANVDVKYNILGGLPALSILNGGKARGGIVGGDSAMDAFARGGIVGGSTRFIRVNEESPEMIIPLSDQRRGRALKLWAQAGNIMGVPGFARGGIVGGNGSDEGIRFNTYDSGSESAGGRTVHVDVGGVTLEINVSGSDRESIIDAIKAQAGEIADYMVGVIADALETEFQNTPVRGGVA